MVTSLRSLLLQDLCSAQRLCEADRQTEPGAARTSTLFRLLPILVVTTATSRKELSSSSESLDSSFSSVSGWFTLSWLGISLASVLHQQHFLCGKIHIHERFRLRLLSPACLYT
ncbi:hypothetical protein FKM82_026469, partial [Ascaphus truei]